MDDPNTAKMQGAGRDVGNGSRFAAQHEIGTAKTKGCG